MIEHRFVSEFSIIMIYAKRLGILDHLKNRMPAVPRSFISGANLLMILVFCLITGRQPLYAMSRFVSKLDGRIGMFHFPVNTFSCQSGWPTCEHKKKCKLLFSRYERCPFFHNPELKYKRSGRGCKPRPAEVYYPPEQVCNLLRNAFS